MNAVHLQPPCEAAALAYDPTSEAREYGIVICADPDADDMGEWDAERRMIRVRPDGWTYARSTATFQLAYALLDEPSREEAITFAAQRLIDRDDLEAIASVTSDRFLWARVLRVRPCLLLAHLALLGGLPQAAAA